MKVSALAITYNEEANIESFLKQMQFADEIIIVDSFSTDRTKEIAASYNAKFIKRQFTNFSDQKNFAIQQASHDWILFFDPDEYISDSLLKEIKTCIRNPQDTVAFNVKRRFHFMGKRIQYSGFQNDYAVRIFNKNYCKYNGNLVHENLEINGKTTKLKGILEHYSYTNYDDYNAKQTHYASLQAQKLYEENKRPKLYHFLIRPLYRFCHQYVIRLGFMDGKEGFILAYLSAFSVFKRYLILWTKYRNIE